MRILHLTLKKKWFDMILSGEKREEYREIKPYWIKRLDGKQFDAVYFKNGYGKDSPSMLVECKDIYKSTGQVSWGAPSTFPVYCILLGEILQNCVDKGNSGE